MNSAIGNGRVFHERLEPISHAFQYPLFVLAVDLAELPALATSTRWFGHNHRAPFAIHDADYVVDGHGSIREKLDAFLTRAGCREGVEQVTLVTCPRVFGYAFNPVSFYFCHHGDGSLRVAVAEVNNTFGERHLYILGDAEREDATAEAVRFRSDKTFHVSPFNDVTGRYEFLFGDLRKGLDARVNLWRGDTCVFRSGLVADFEPLTGANLRRTLARQPLAMAKTMPRIIAQAARLYFVRRLPVFTKPHPSSEMTIRVAPPSVLQRACRALVQRAFGKLRSGTLVVVEPGRRRAVFGGNEPGPAGEITVLSPAFYSKAALGGDVGFGESYQDGDWTTPDLTAVLSVFAANLRHFDDRSMRLTWPTRLANAVRHRLRPNSQRGSRRNIREHYDLGNDFYAKFLDRTMMYSCAIHRSADQTLEQAQLEKIGAMAALARIDAGCHVLEIGTGWGGFAIETVRRTGCRMTTVTISEEQHRLALARVREEGLEDRIDVRLCDYRDLEGSFDRIVSIEMLEAVGHKYLPAFFSTCDRLLKPGGLLALQVITIPDQRYEAYRSGCDWIQKHIFPGGFLPSLGALCGAARDHSRLVVEKLENIGPHYATTLREWRRGFEANWPAIRDMGFDERFRRTWDYYFAYCESGFAERAIGTLQLVMARPERRSES